MSKTDSYWTELWVATTGGRDRKSTRLNSSHLVISYAVFCLKKKHSRHCTSRDRSPEFNCSPLEMKIQNVSRVSYSLGGLHFNHSNLQLEAVLSYEHRAELID